MRRVVAAMLLLLCACGDEPARGPKAPARPEATIGGRPASEYFIEHDRFLSVTDPATVSRGQARFLQPNDEVFGVFEGGKARAYPITMMSYYHVANDIVGGVPVAVTY